MTTALMRQEAQIQAVYLKYLADKAKQQALDLDNADLAFDLQGRILVDVTLTDDDIKNILSDRPEGMAAQTVEVALEKALGRKPSRTTTVSLDINNMPELKDKFDARLQSVLNPISSIQTNDIIIALHQTAKGSIIALQQEFHFHLALASRLYPKVTEGRDNWMDDVQMRQAHQETMLVVNHLIMDSYAKALNASFNSEQRVIDIAKLNKQLNLARKSIMPQAHRILMSRIIAITGHELDVSEMEKSQEGSSLKKCAEATTATPNDLLHLDAEHGLLTLIEGSEQTAHHREKGAEFAHRQLITYGLSPSGEIKVPEVPTIQIRVPSLALKKGLKNDNAYVADVAVKLLAIKDKYKLADRLELKGQKPAAFVMNLLTAINHTAGDAFGNLQTQSAKHILKGVHFYNVQQLDDARPVLSFVQNISVNGFGDTLGYGSGNNLREECTLMAEMAMLHSLYDSFSETDKSAAHRVFELYETYLKSPQKPDYFSQSSEGHTAITALNLIKDHWKKEELCPTDQDKVIDIAKSALRNLMAHDLHQKHEYSKLIQSLSVFVQEASASGCKSANERLQAVNGRTAVFQGLLNERLSVEQFAVRVSLANLAADPRAAIGHADVLNLALNVAYNSSGLQTAASMVSLLDQGASAKLNAHSGSHSIFTSTNDGEESNKIMLNLSQGKAGAMQAHKDLTKHMKAACPHQSWWSRMKSSPLGLVGAILGCVVVPIALAVAAYGVYDNHRRAVALNQADELCERVLSAAEISKTTSIAHLEDVDEEKHDTELAQAHGNHFQYTAVSLDSLSAYRDVRPNMSRELDRPAVSFEKQQLLKAGLQALRPTDNCDNTLPDSPRHG